LILPEEFCSGHEENALLLAMKFFMVRQQRVFLVSGALLCWCLIEDFLPETVKNQPETVKNQLIGLWECQSRGSLVQFRQKLKKTRTQISTWI
jgi:hypothetical protein